MSMSVGSPSDEERTEKSDINTTPLVDVMLVLLIIFLITIPVITKTVKVELPVQVMVPSTFVPRMVLLKVATAALVW